MSVFLEILEWFDETGEAMVHRLPPEGSADIKFGAQLIVRESQEALFYTGGQVRDRFGPGRHSLSSKNLPLVTAALSLPWGFKSPFRCEVYFVNRKTFTNLKWGTREPVVFRDARLGFVRLRAHGQTSFRVTDPERFIHDLVGTRGSFTTHDATDYLRDVIVARLNDYLGENLTTLFDLPALYDEMGDQVKERLGSDFGKYGMEMEDFFITSITPPEEVQTMIDGRGSLSLVDDMPGYLQYQMARAIGGQTPPGASGNGGPREMVDAGVGLGMGMLLPQMVAGAATSATAVRPATGSGFCTSCGQGLQPGDRFCACCGHQVGAQVEPTEESAPPSEQED